MIKTLYFEIRPLGKKPVGVSVFKSAAPNQYRLEHLLRLGDSSYSSIFSVSENTATNYIVVSLFRRGEKTAVMSYSLPFKKIDFFIGPPPNGMPGAMESLIFTVPEQFKLVEMLLDAGDDTIEGIPERDPKEVFDAITRRT